MKQCYVGERRKPLGRTHLSVALGLALFSPWGHAASGTLTLSGTGENTANADGTGPYDALIIENGQWHLHGQLVSGTSTIKTGGAALLNDDFNLGNGLILVQGGTLQADRSGISLDNEIRLNASGMIINGAYDLTLNGLINGGGGMTKSGTGELILTSSNNYSAYTILNSGTLVVKNNNATSTGVLTLNGGTLQSAGQNISLANFIANVTGNVTMDTQSNLTFTGRMMGNGTLTKTGEGRLRVDGTYNNNGNIILKAGTLDVASNTNLGFGSLLVDGGALDSDIDQNWAGSIVLRGDLSLNGPRNWNFSGALSGDGGLILNSNTTTTLSGNNTSRGDIQLNQGTLAIASDSALGTGGIVFGGGILTNTAALSHTNASLKVQNLPALIRAAHDWTMQGALVGQGTFTKTGLGDLTLLGNVSGFDGVLQVQQGNMFVRQAYQGFVDLNTNTQLQLGTDDDVVSARTLQGILKLGDGNDTFSVQVRDLDQMTGTIDGEDGFNRFEVTNSGQPYEADLDADRFVHFSSLALRYGSILTLMHDGQFSSAFDPNSIGLFVDPTSGFNLNGHTLKVGRADVQGALVGSGVLDGHLTTSSFVAPSGIPGRTGRLQEQSNMGLMRVTGDLDVMEGQWIIHANPEGESDQVVVDGNVRLQGGTVVALPKAGIYGEKTTYSFLRSSGTRTGQFDGVVQNQFAFLTASLEHKDNGVDLVLSRQVQPEPPVVITPEPIVPPVIVPEAPPVANPTPGSVSQPPIVSPPSTPDPVAPPVIVPETPPVADPIPGPVSQPPVVSPPSTPDPGSTSPVNEDLKAPDPKGKPLVEQPHQPEPIQTPEILPEPLPGALAYQNFEGLTRNQKSMAGALQRNENNGLGQLYQLLGQVRALNQDEVVSAFDQLTGESYASLTSHQAQVIEQVLDVLRQRQREIENGLSVWADQLWAQDILRTQFDTSSIESRFHGVMVGVDVGGETFGAGAYLYQGDSSFNHTDRPEKIDQRHLGGGLRGQWDHGNLRVKAQWGYAKHDTDSQRFISIAGNDTFATHATTRGATQYVGLEGALQFQTHNFTIAPTVGASYLHSSMKDFVEQTDLNAPEAALRVSQSSIDHTVLWGELQASQTIVSQRSTMTLYGGLGYEYQAQDNRDHILVSFASTSTPFDILGSEEKRGQWKANVGANYQRDAWTLRASAVVNLSQKNASYGAQVGVQYRF